MGYACPQKDNKMDLKQIIIPATQGQTRFTGSSSFSAVFGKRLKIELSPGGPEILNIAVPSGKKWQNGRIELYFEEVDA